jgi:hypothetical protein
LYVKHANNYLRGFSFTFFDMILSFSKNYQEGTTRLARSKTPDQDPGPLILFSKIIVPGIGRLSNSILKELQEFAS